MDVIFLIRFLGLILMKFGRYVLRQKLESKFNLVNFGLGVDNMLDKRFLIINDELLNRIFIGSIQVKVDIVKV